MKKNLYDVKINEMDLPNDIIKKLKKHGFDSVAHLLTVPTKEIEKLGFSSVKVTKIRAKASHLGKQYGFGKKQIQEKVGTLLLQNEFLHFMNMDRSTFIQFEEKGLTKEIVLYTGIDIIPCPNKNGNIPKKLFIKEKGEELRSRYTTLLSISKNNHIPYYLLLKYAQKGLLDEARITHIYFDSHWIQDHIVRIKKEVTRKHFSNTQSEQLWKRLNNDQQRLIEDYLDYRNQFNVVFNKHTQFKKFTKDDAYLDHKKCLVRMFYSMICERSGIKNYWVRDENGFAYRALSPVEEERFNADLFDFETLNDQDIIAISHGKKGVSTKNYYRNTLRGLFYYTLMLQKEQIKKRKKESDEFDYERAYASLVWEAEELEDTFMKYLPEEPPPSSLDRSVFFVRLTVSKMISRILQNKRLNFRNPLKNAAMIALAFFGIVRPVEIWKMRIDKHLLINKSTGLLETVTIAGKVFGKVIITKDISKKSISPSGPFDLLLVPRAVTIINSYLKDLYKKYPHTKGKGYLFRPDDREWIADECYASSKTLFEWIGKNKHAFSDILTPKELKDFSSYDTRHTGNNWIVRKTFFADPILEEFKEDVAEYHARHKSTKSVSKKHYQEKLTEEIYATIINAAMNFPFDEEELIAWEKKMYESAKSSSQPDTVTKPEENNEDLNKIEAKMKNIQDELDQLNKYSYQVKLGITLDERLKRAEELHLELMQLEQKKSKLTRG